MSTVEQPVECTPGRGCAVAAEVSQVRIIAQRAEKTADDAHTRINAGLLLLIGNLIVAVITLLTIIAKGMP